MAVSPPPTPVRQPAVHPKVVAGALAGAVVTIADWLLRQFAGVNQPAEVVAAEVVIVSTLVAWYVPGSATGS